MEPTTVPCWLASAKGNGFSTQSGLREAEMVLMIFPMNRVELIDRNGAPISKGKNGVADKFFKLAVFRKGVQSLGVNQVITSFLFSVPQLNGEIGGGIFEQYIGVRASFQDVEGNNFANEFSIDFAEFEGITELGGSPIYNISNELKTIREQLGRSLGSSAGRIGVDVYTSSDREIESEERMAWIEEQKAAAK